MTINVENMRAWVAALRSGRYKQGLNRLRTDDRFCCLGVACDISGLTQWTKNDMNQDVYFDLHRILPHEVQTWLGVSSGDPDLLVNGLRTSAAYMNDYRGLTFAQIADAIEETWPEVKQ